TPAACSWGSLWVIRSLQFLRVPSALARADDDGPVGGDVFTPPDLTRRVANLDPAGTLRLAKTKMGNRLHLAQITASTIDEANRRAIVTFCKQRDPRAYGRRAVLRLRMHAQPMISVRRVQEQGVWHRRHFTMGDEQVEESVSI